MKLLKILAACLATVLMMTCFAGCNLKDKIVGGMQDAVGNMQEQMQQQVQSQMNDMLNEMQSQLSELESEPDYAAAIDDFVSDSLNTFTIKVGEAHKPTAAVWVQGGNGHTYTSDSSVVTVSNGGKVTAVSEGSAYVVIAASSTMYRVYLYNVVA